jgi:serine/threonine-protein kinase
VFERLAREHPESPDYASSLGVTHHNLAKIDIEAKRFEQARRRFQQAISWQRKALAANRRHPQYQQFLRGHLSGLVAAATALGEAGEAEAAERELDELVASDPTKRALDQRLAAVIGGERPKDNAERLQLADRAYEKKLNAESARLYAEALEADPKLADDRQQQHRLHAACTAAAAASVKPGVARQAEKPLTDADRAKLRIQARAWLEAELKTWSGLLESAKPEQRQAIALSLMDWQWQTDLAAVRDEAALARLPGDERDAWKALWAKFGALLKRAGGSSG